MDQDLVVRAQRGDRRAFEALTAGDYPRLFRLACAILQDRPQAEDATQQAYLDIWRNIEGLHSPSHFEAWSYRILVNACHAETRQAPRWLPETALSDGQIPRAADPYGQVLDRDQIERGLRRLTIPQRMVIVLHYHLGMTLAQIAEALRIPIGTVDSRLHRALRSMRVALAVKTRQARVGVRARALQRPDATASRRRPTGTRSRSRPSALWIRRRALRRPRRRLRGPGTS
jgi:RNA polymerase sigma-70 factor (ECF subfamily)